MSALPEQVQKLVDYLRERGKVATYGDATEVQTALCFEAAGALVDAYARPAGDVDVDTAYNIGAEIVDVQSDFDADADPSIPNGTPYRRATGYAALKAILARFPSVGRKDETVSSACDSPCESQSTANADLERSALTQGADAVTHVLTVGDLRREMAGLDDACTVGICVDRGGVGPNSRTDDYGAGISVEADSDGDAGWLTIIVDAASPVSSVPVRADPMTAMCRAWEEYRESAESPNSPLRAFDAGFAAGLKAALSVPAVPVTPLGDLVTTWRKWSDSFRAQGNPPASTAADYIAQCANELESALAVPVGDVDAEAMDLARRLERWAHQRDLESKIDGPHDAGKRSRTEMLREAAAALRVSRPAPPMQPCPVCEGRGTMGSSFYGLESPTNAPITCRTCNGATVISPSREPQSPQNEVAPVVASPPSERIVMERRDEAAIVLVALEHLFQSTNLPDEFEDRVADLIVSWRQKARVNVVARPTLEPATHADSAAASSPEKT